ARREGSLTWGVVRRFIRLNKPREPKTGAERVRVLWRAPLFWPIVLLCLGLGAVIPVLLIVLRRFTTFDYYGYPFLLWPAYANVTELASPEWAGQWGMAFVVLLSWAWSAFFAEELLFRGVLLPRMSAVFAKRDWVANALLYALYHLHQYWMIPFRLIEGLILARQTRRFSSYWMTVAIRSVEGLGVLTLVGLGVTSQPLTALPAPEELPYIGRRPAPSALYRGPMAAIPAYDPSGGSSVDLRGADLSALDLRDAFDDLAFADFDTRTAWPPADRMPVGYDPATVLDLGKNPGLGVHTLHSQGITGRGVGVAIIDQPLLTEHSEYAARLRWYEEIPGSFASPAQMHGPAVASLAVGLTVGVAPEADLYYIGGAGSSLQSVLLYSHDFAQGIRRILQINEQLPTERKIRAISISNGWQPWIAGYQDVVAAVREAEAAGMLVLDVETGSGLPSHGLSGLGRPLLADPDAFESYGPGLFWAVRFCTPDFRPDGLLLAPMDSRTVASAAGRDDYEFGRTGGMSWVPPYLAGLYALAAQADPTITPDRFWSAALQTGRTIQVESDGCRGSLGTIIDPVGLVDALRTR
ncbi:MAG: CPBP family intramembrane metalloprotease, partial [Chloroflexi bacterium]|nr:CPBP family intramembrane metalloprotease [Chloroflexota bacterium]